MLGKVSSLNTELKQLVGNHDYHGIYVKLLNFCTIDLSAFYFDIRKDSSIVTRLRVIKENLFQQLYTFSLSF